MLPFSVGFKIMPTLTQLTKLTLTETNAQQPSDTTLVLCTQQLTTLSSAQNLNAQISFPNYYQTNQQQYVIAPPSTYSQSNDKTSKL